MSIVPLTISLLPETLAICRLEPGTSLPQWVPTDTFFSITGTDDELSLVCSMKAVPDNVKVDGDWRGFKLHGPFPFSLVGILNSVTIPLAQANIGIFAISTYDTDYVLIKESNLSLAITTLRDAGHTLHTNE